MVWYVLLRAYGQRLLKAPLYSIDCSSTYARSVTSVYTNYVSFRWGVANVL